MLKLMVGGLLLLAVLAGCGENAAPESAPNEPSPSPTGTPMETPPTVTPAPAPVPTPTLRPVVAVSTQPPATEYAATPVPTESFPTPPERDYYRLARELMPGVGEIDPVVRNNAPTLQEGHRETFKLVDLEAPEQYESDFVLRLVTPSAYWFVEDGIEVEQEALERSAGEFESTIYPQVTGVFGSEWTPGVDGDPHLYVINANLRGVGGYFSAADEYPRALRPVSNEIEAIYINVRYLPPGSTVYSQVLAHELQHAAHWNADVSEETWVNEGLSELAVTVAGFPETSMQAFRTAGPTSLLLWPANGVGTGKNYGAASMFMHYLSEHFGGRDNLRPLLEQPGDGIEGIDAYLEASGYEARFIDVFRDWALANLLDEDSGPYGYADLPAPLPVYRNLASRNELASTIPQYANEYVRLEQLPGPVVLSFNGDAATPLLPVDASREGCWWSNKGDVINSTLTAGLDLRQVENARLDYQVWFSIEEDWDYAYVELSEDSGETWTILETPLTSSDDPLDVSFGPGYTGATDGWQNESLSLAKWAGQEIMVRFQYITDAAIHDHGLCLRHLRVHEHGTEPALPAEWTPSGFVWTNNLVRQVFIVQVVYEGQGDSPNRVLPMTLNGNNRGELTLEPHDDARRIVAVVQSVAPSTRIPANYAMRLEPAQ